MDTQITGSGKSGIELIAQERQEQLTKHDKIIVYDVRVNDSQQLREAARRLLMKRDGSDNVEEEMSQVPRDWDKELWKKMYRKPYKERMILAGALIAAEIDRINNMGI